MNDITYIQNGFFTRFLPDTKDGEGAVNEIIRVTGDNVIRNDHLKAILKQLRQAGYKVKKAIVTKESKEKVLAEIDDLLDQLVV
jgi:hypothetical protein